MAPHRFRSRILTVQTIVVAEEGKGSHARMEAVPIGAAAESVSLPKISTTIALPILSADMQESLVSATEAIRKPGSAAMRQTIRDSGVVEALLEFVEGRREMSASQVSTALGLLKKIVSDLSAASLSASDEDKNCSICSDDE